MYSCTKCNFETENKQQYVAHCKFHKTTKCTYCNRNILIEQLEEHIHNRCKHARDNIGRIQPGCASTEEKELLRRQKISATMKKNKQSGGYRQNSGRSIKTWFVSKFCGEVFLQSSYELEYAKYLEENNIEWKKNWIKFPYTYKHEIHYYIPDFYLIKEDKYIETKGYKIEKDEYKWKEFPYKLEILFRQDLKNLGLKIT